MGPVIGIAGVGGTRGPGQVPDHHHTIADVQIEIPARRRHLHQSGHFGPIAEQIAPVGFQNEMHGIAGRDGPQRIAIGRDQRRLGVDRAPDSGRAWFIVHQRANVVLGNPAGEEVMVQSAGLNERQTQQQHGEPRKHGEPSPVRGRISSAIRPLTGLGSPSSSIDANPESQAQSDAGRTERRRDRQVAIQSDPQGPGCSDPDKRRLPEVPRKRRAHYS